MCQWKVDCLTADPAQDRKAKAKPPRKLHVVTGGGDNFETWIYTPRGHIAGCLANAITVLSRLSLRYNAFRCQPFLEKESPWGTSGDWTDYDDMKCAEWCQRSGLGIEKNMAGDAALAVALSRRPHFHPVTAYLESLQWDRQRRLDKWLARYLGVKETPYACGVGSKWMIAAVKRAFEPGCQSDYTLVLEGAQGRRKSTALRILAGGAGAGSEWFTDDVSDIGTASSAMQLQGKWIVELAELDAFRKAEMTTIKAWLVRREDNFRPPYARRAQQFSRQNIFAASTNKDDWGQDETGLRRFWPVKVGAIDIAGLSAIRDQLWAEAYVRYRSSESTWLGDDLNSEAASEQQDRMETDAWDELIMEWVIRPEAGLTSIRSEPKKVYLPEILQYCLKLDPSDWTQTHKNRVSKILRTAGWASKREPRDRAESDGKRSEFWYPMRGDS